MVEEKISDGFDRKWITENSLDFLSQYAGGITLRQLYYRLVSRGMINDTLHYKRVVSAMTDARWKGDVDMDAFIDRERAMFGETKSEEKDVDDEIENAKKQVEAWMTGYRLNMWSNQNAYVEVWVEKKAIQGVFEKPCEKLGVGLAPCKGYPSITFLNEASERFADKNNVQILYFGDYDPSGEDIPHSIQDNLTRMGATVEIERVALNPDLIAKLGLPSVPPKPTDSRTRNWDGNGAVELDAVEPKMLAEMCSKAILGYFDTDLYAELNEKEDEERVKYQKALKDFVQKMKIGEK